jgi:hypothetical protein
VAATTGVEYSIIISWQRSNFLAGITGMQRNVELPRWLTAIAFASLTLFPSCTWQASPKVEVAPVSGAVRLDGQPVENVKVLFVPIDRHETGSRLPLAFAVTDENGRFTLAHTGGENGAVTGRNQVWLTTRRTEPTKQGESESPGVTEISPELLPARYNRATELVFDVPPEGTDRADFDLKSD